MYLLVKADGNVFIPLSLHGTVAGAQGARQNLRPLLIAVGTPDVENALGQYKVHEVQVDIKDTDLDPDGESGGPVDGETGVEE
jgi:hypothetical protein